MARFYYDNANISSREKTPEGYLRVSARAGREGIQIYYSEDFEGDEIPERLRDAEELRMFRPADEVFDPSSLASFALKPVTNDHPPEDVTAENVKKYQIGVLIDAEQASGDVVASLVIHDADAIKIIENGKTQVSLGYSAVVDWNVPEGAEYDGIFRDIRGNHIAIVDAARAGSAYRLLDSAAGEDENMSVAKKAAKATKPAAARRKVRDEEEKREDELPEEESKEEVQEEDADVETLTAQLQAALARIAELESQLTDEDEEPDEDDEKTLEDEVEKRVADGVRERLSVIDTARRVWSAVPVSGSNTAIRLAVIDHLTGGKSTVDRKNPAIVRAVFDALANMPKVKTDGHLAAPATFSVADKARAEMIARRTGGK